jgi:hypothetical protein
MVHRVAGELVSRSAGTGVHLAHDLASMRIDGDLADAKLVAYSLVQAAASTRSPEPQTCSTNPPNPCVKSYDASPIPSSHCSASTLLFLLLCGVRFIPMEQILRFDRL